MTQPLTLKEFSSSKKCAPREEWRRLAGPDIPLGDVSRILTYEETSGCVLLLHNGQFVTVVETEAYFGSRHDCERVLYLDWYFEHCIADYTEETLTDALHHWCNRHGLAFTTDIATLQNDAANASVSPYDQAWLSRLAAIWQQAVGP